MKIYTRIDYQWDDHAGIYRIFSADSHDYLGPLALCTGAEEAIPIVGEGLGLWGGEEAAAGLAGEGLGLFGGGEALAGAGAGAGAAGAEVGAGFVPGISEASLSGGLAAPATTSAFLAGVPEAAAGTTLPIGGAALDITAPGAAQAATAAGSALGPGSGTPSLLPGAAPAGGAPGAIPTGGAPGAPIPPTGTPPGPQSAIGTPAPGPTPVSSATASGVTGSPVGGTGAPGVPGGGAPGLPAPVTDLSTAASAADKARLAANTSLADKAIGAITKNPLTAGALGLNAMSQINARRQGKTLSEQLKAGAKPASSVADKFLAEGLSGKPSASTSYEIDQWVQNQSAAIKQRYANMGRDPNNDSAAAKELSDINAKAVAMKDAAAQGLVTQGLQAANIAQGPTTQAALAAAQQDKDLAASMGQTLHSLALLQAIQGRGA